MKKLIKNLEAKTLKNTKTIKGGGQTNPPVNNGEVWVWVIQGK
jgi:hypothetical protein